ncbi:hypothetical protein AtDm6_0528 [Acetobacter tropicalis]|uniref:Uncharacterized protein n=1 Tax=Acetobacter tropicalis TaxID=104102 RepID=A0A095B992_9PROT|nr:hypothetical protein AtDm6_0528 [Acetobacter tropicalis]
MLSRLSDQACACNSQLSRHMLPAHDVLHGKEWRYKHSGKIFSKYFQEDFRVGRCSSSFRQGGYNS